MSVEKISKDRKTANDKRKSKKKHSLSHGRPPTAQKLTPSISSKATRNIIRSHHQLEKSLFQAVKDGNANRAAEIRKQIDAQGGLKAYQLASITGQSSDRGGDSSKILMEWLQDYQLDQKTEASTTYSMLEVGALSTKNACSRSNLFSVTRIDLHPQNAEIQRQDFMARPLPEKEDDKFDIISLSLVLNYVPNDPGRGKMLQRLPLFLKSRPKSDMTAENTATQEVFPSLFLVLPAPCVENSRYLTYELLCQMMASLRFFVIKRKTTEKLVYYLFKYNPDARNQPKRFPKKAVNGGSNRNNFCIIIR